MGELLLLLVVALTVAAIVFGVAVLITGGDRGLAPAEPDGRAVPLPGDRPLVEADIATVRFDTALRGYRMAQVDQALRRAAYDIGYKDELIGVLEAEVAALREGRLAEADVLRRAREAAAAPQGAGPATAGARSGALEGAAGDKATGTTSAGDKATGMPSGGDEATGTASGGGAATDAATSDAAEQGAPGRAAGGPAARGSDIPAEGGPDIPAEGGPDTPAERGPAGPDGGPGGGPADDYATVDASGAERP